MVKQTVRFTESKKGRFTILARAGIPDTVSEIFRSMGYIYKNELVTYAIDVTPSIAVKRWGVSRRFQIATRMIPRERRTSCFPPSKVGRGGGYFTISKPTSLGKLVIIGISSNQIGVANLSLLVSIIEQWNVSPRN